MRSPQQHIVSAQYANCYPRFMSLWVDEMTSDVINSDVYDDISCGCFDDNVDNDDDKVQLFYGSGRVITYTTRFKPFKHHVERSLVQYTNTYPYYLPNYDAHSGVQKYRKKLTKRDKDCLLTSH
uniref:Uncharacterized protein n=1 Tax=Glossina pallidipes TaxID=7398 RepID=A0A1A9ZBN3_GLOPL